MEKIMVVGIGNPLLKDEGIGVHVANRMLRMNLPAGVEVIDGGTNTYDLVDFFCQADKLIIVDALKAGGEPGTLYRAPLEKLGLAPEENAVSLHQMHFIEAMHMVVKLLGSNPETVVFGIEPGDMNWGTELTAAVEEKIPRIIELILEEIDRMTAD